MLKTKESIDHLLKHGLSGVWVPSSGQRGQTIFFCRLFCTKYTNWHEITQEVRDKNKQNQLSSVFPFSISSFIIFTLSSFLHKKRIRKQAGYYVEHNITMILGRLAHKFLFMLP